MILELSSKKVTLDERTTRYVERKLSALEKLVVKDDRASVRAEVTLRRVDRAHGNKYEAEVKLHLPHAKLKAEDTTLNVLAALDIVCAKLARELKNHKDQRLPRRQNRV